MLTALTSMLSGSSQPTHPSTILMLGPLTTHAYVLHILPEDGTVEHLSRTQYPTTTFRYGGAKETSREQLGNVFLHVGDGETVSVFLDEVSKRVTKILSELQSEKAAAGDKGTAPATTHEALRSATQACMDERTRRQPPKNAAQEYPVFLVRIERSRAGRLFTEAELTSFPRRFW